MEWFRHRPPQRRKSLSFRDQPWRRNIPAGQPHPLTLTRMAHHHRFLQELMLRPAHQLGVAASVVASGSPAAQRRQSVTLGNTSRSVRATFAPGLPVLRCTPVPIPCQPRRPILGLTHDKSIRVQLIPIRGNKNLPLGKRDRLARQ
jgi:hypothetical protein